MKKVSPKLSLVTKTCIKCFQPRPSIEFPYKRNVCYLCKNKQAKEWRDKNSNNLELYLKSILNSARSRAKKNGFKFTITYADLLTLYTNQKGLCALSEKELTFKKSVGKTYTNISIDRINNKKGYTKDNIQLVCHIVNLMKNTMTLHELKEWCNAIVTKKD